MGIYCYKPKNSLFQKSQKYCFQDHKIIATDFTIGRLVKNENKNKEVTV